MKMWARVHIKGLLLIDLFKFLEKESFPPFFGREIIRTFSSQKAIYFRGLQFHFCAENASNFKRFSFQSFGFHVKDKNFFKRQLKLSDFSLPLILLFLWWLRIGLTFSIIISVVFCCWRGKKLQSFHIINSHSPENPFPGWQGELRKLKVWSCSKLCDSLRWLNKSKSRDFSFVQ